LLEKAHKYYVSLKIYHITLIEGKLGTSVLVMMAVPRDGVEYYHGLREYLLFKTDFSPWISPADKSLVRRETGTLPMDT
jgi:hypothetical protein